MDLVLRVKLLEERCDALRASLNVTHLATLALVRALELQTNDTEGLIRKAMVQSISNDLEESNLSEAAKTAARKAIASFNPVSHDEGPESGDSSGQH